MRLYRNSRITDPGRLVYAGLFSLVLHASLLFFVSYVQPAWTNVSSENLPLQVRLENQAAESAMPAGMPLASQISAGESKIGVQNKKRILQEKLAEAKHELGDRLLTEIPKGFISQKILAIDQPQRMKMAGLGERASDFLVTKNPDHVAPEPPETREGAYAPAPSVANPIEGATPSIEKLLSSEPIPGARHESIVMAEPVYKKPATESTLSVKPDRSSEAVRHTTMEKTKPAQAEEAKQAKAEEIKPAKVEEAKPARTDAMAEQKVLPAEGGKSAVFRESPPGLEAPRQFVLGIPLVRKIIIEDEKRIQPAERRKSISIREKDFRYAMYIEGLRLKLERIGSLNYPSSEAGEGLSGTLSVIISIRSDGSLEDFSIAKPSQHEELNAGAEKIVRMSAPFSPLPENIRREADVLSITIKWNFSRLGQSFD